MTAVPHFNMPVSTEVMLLTNLYKANSKAESDYEMTNLDGGEIIVVPFEKLTEHLHLPRAKINTELPETGERMKTRLGGLLSALRLPEHQ